MDSHTTNLPRAATAVALSALAFWFGTGLHPIWWATWLTSVPVLVVAPRLKTRHAFMTAFFAHLLGNLNEWTYASLLPLPAHLVFVILPAVGFGLAVLLFRTASVRGKLWQAWLSFPTAWIAYEYVVAWLSPHSTFGNLAYNQMNFLPVIQIASVTGIWGISFCLLIFASTAAIATNASLRTAPHTRVVFALTLLGLAGTIGFGFWRVRSSAHEPSVIVGLVSSDQPETTLPAQSDSLAIFRRYLIEVPALVARGAKVIVLPEYIADFSASASKDETTAVNQLFSKAARDHQATIAVGLGRIVDSNTAFNEARVYSETGDVVVYDKHHFLPGYESRFTAGNTLALLPTVPAPWGVQICKDLDFPALSRAYASKEIGLLLVSANDFKLDAWLHSRMAILRGVEGGFSVARSARNGVLTLSDNRGRVLAEEYSNSATFAHLVGTVPTFHSETLYSRLGDWFAWLNLGVLLSSVITTFRWTRPRNLFSAFERSHDSIRIVDTATPGATARQL